MCPFFLQEEISKNAHMQKNKKAKKRSGSKHLLSGTRNLGLKLSSMGKMLCIQATLIIILEVL
jgi:hypothetical protein